MAPRRFPERRGVFRRLVIALTFASAAGNAGCTPSEQGASPADVPSVAIDEAAVLASFEEYAAPGAAHARILERAGTWDLEFRFWAAPDAAPTEASGVSTIEILWDGRYAVERMKSEMMGAAFEGMGITGFDKFKDRYVAIWMDSLSTGIMRQEGVADGNLIEYLGESPDYTTRGYKTVRTLESTIDAGERRVVMYDTAPDGAEFVTMEIIYRRRK